MVSTSSKKRQSPKKHRTKKKVSSNLNDIRKQLNKQTLGKLWQFIDNDNNIVFSLKSSNDQFHYKVDVSSSLKIGIVYYGWAVTHSKLLNDLQHSLTKCQINKVLEQIERISICKGCDAIGPTNKLISHIVTKSAKPFSEGENAIPSSSVLAYRYSL